MIAKQKRKLRKVCRNYEQVENYEKAIADEENKWEMHHRRETDENKSRQHLIDEGKYYDVDPSELIFLTRAEHNKIHNIRKHHSEETRKKMSEAQSNRSEETRKKMSENHKGMLGKTHSEETRKKMSENSAKYWLGKQKPEEAKKKLSASIKGLKYWNNGKISIRAKECPEGFTKGRLKYKRNANKKLLV